MKIIQKFSLAAIVAALTVSASAFPYSQPHFGPPQTNEPANEVVAINRAPGRTIGVFVRGQGIGSPAYSRPDDKYRPNWAGKVTLHGWD